MNLKNLKAYHAYYVIAALYLITSLLSRNFVFFPLACAFLCIAIIKQSKENGHLKKPEDPRS